MEDEINVDFDTVEFKNNTKPAMNATFLNNLQEKFKSNFQIMVDGVNKLINTSKTTVDNFISENQKKIDTELGKLSGASGLPIGSGCDYFGTTAPEGYMFADGSALSRAEYPELFKILGTTYGTGSGDTEFNLPDKRERVSVMYKSGSTNFGTLGKKIGEDTHKLTVNELATHNHTQAQHRHSSNGASVEVTTGRYDVMRSSTLASAAGAATGYTNYETPSINNTGGNAAHNNIQQSFVCNYIIKVK